MADISRYRHDCAGFSWSAGSAGGVCYAASADAHYEYFSGKTSSQYLRLSSAKWAEESVELPGLDWGNRPRDFSCQIQRWNDKVPLVRIGNEVIETNDDPETENPVIGFIGVIVLAAMAVFIGIRAARSVKAFEKHEAELYAHSQREE